MAENNQTQPDSQKKDDIIFFAETNFRNQKVKFGIKTDDRRRHMYLIGKTGMGKSTVMENMIIQDIVNGKGVALVDPHGDFAEKILDFIPSQRINDVVYLNPADREYPIAFNVMESVSQEHKHLIASGLVGVFKKLWADSWGPRLEYVLRNAILALLDYPGSTLLGVMRILVDKTYREKVIDKIKDPVVKSFWVDEYSRYPQQFQAEAIAPIQNKVGQFLSTSLIRNVVGQVKSTIDLRYIMDNKKILIMNLSKGRIGEDSSALLGAMMITKIQLAAMSRIDILEKDRQDFYLYVDEFQNFATESFGNILSEARKYRLNLIIGHQYIEQLDELVQAAVFGNVGTIMCFRIGPADAEFLATEFAPYFEEEDLVNLSKYDIYMRLMIDGVASNPFSATTLPPLGKNLITNNKEKVITVSRERYAKPRAVVEDKISRWSGVMMDEAEKEVENLETNRQKKFTGGKPADLTLGQTSGGSGKKKKKKKAANEQQQNFERKPLEKPPLTSQVVKGKNTYTVSCYECGKPTEITFKPDGVRPIYCQNCFQKIREKLMEGEEKEIAMQEVKIAEEPEISLEEALGKKPQDFEVKREKPTQKEEVVKIDSKETTPKLTLQDLIAKKAALKNQGDTLEKNSNNAVKTLNPGQIVKF